MPIRVTGVDVSVLRSGPASARVTGVDVAVLRQTNSNARVTGISAQVLVPQTGYPRKLQLNNPGFEAGNATGWTRVDTGSGSLVIVNAPADAYSGTFYARSASSEFSWYTQTVILPPDTYADIDAGLLKAVGAAWHNNWSDDIDQGNIGLDAFDENDVWLAGWFEPRNDDSGWTLKQTELWLPPSTRKVRIGLRSRRYAGTNNDNYWDDVQLFIAEEDEPFPYGDLVFRERSFDPLNWTNVVGTVTNTNEYWGNDEMRSKWLNSPDSPQCYRSASLISYEAGIDTGLSEFTLFCCQAGWSTTDDPGQIAVQFYDTNNLPVGPEFVNGPIREGDVYGIYDRVFGNIPVGARSVRVTIRGSGPPNGQNYDLFCNRFILYVRSEAPDDAYIEVSKASGYAVLLTPYQSITKATGYAVLGLSAARAGVAKATGYAIMSGRQLITKTTGYSVMNDSTPRFIQVAKNTAYALLGSLAIRVSKAVGYAAMVDAPKPFFQITKALGYAAMAVLVPRVFLSEMMGEASTGGSGNVRLNRIGAEATTGGEPNVRLSDMVGEANTGGNPFVRCSDLVVEALCGIPEEPYMIDPKTHLFPTLKGLAFNVAKRPNFSTRVASNVSGREVRNAFWDDPRWDYELTYDYLPDRPVAQGETDLKTLMGFFLQRRGSFDAFLFHDPDDYIANGYQGTTDGVTLTFDLRRTFGGFVERIGQIDNEQPSEFWYQYPDGDGETRTVPAVAPYQLQASNAPFRNDVKVTLEDGTPLTRVSINPGPNQYTVTAGGLYTFNAARAGQDVKLYYGWTITSGVEVLMPNKLVFDVAPPAGREVWGAFQFYYVCRFLEDSADFEKFMDKLWELQQINFRSIIQ